MLGKAFTIGILFALARRAARETELDELRLKTTMAGREGRQMQEQAARGENLQQMRAASNAQLRMSLADSGVSPMLTMGGGAGGGVQAAHIQRAAVNQSASSGAAGRLSGYGH